MFQLTVSDDIINESWTPMIFHCNSNAVYTDCTSKTLRVINAKYFWNNWLIAKYTLIDYIANKQVWDKLVELRVILLNEKVTEILKHKPEELTDTKGFFLHLIWPDVFLQPITLLKQDYWKFESIKYFKIENIPQHNDCRL